MDRPRISGPLWAMLLAVCFWPTLAYSPPAALPAVIAILLAVATEVGDG